MEHSLLPLPVLPKQAPVALCAPAARALCRSVRREKNYPELHLAAGLPPMLLKLSAEGSTCSPAHNGRLRHIIAVVGGRVEEWLQREIICKAYGRLQAAVEIRSGVSQGRFIP